MRKKEESRERLKEIIKKLRKTYPDAKCSLDYKSPFQLLVATILSAQCTDERVNMVTPALFARFPDAGAMAKAKLADVEKLVQSTGFYKNKAKSLVEMSQALIERHGGNVPNDLDALVALRGVGRKTANVILGNAFDIPGMVVDTHVGRLARRMGFTKNEDPVKVEQDLMQIAPKSEWTHLAHLFISHGRARCMARKPDCLHCEVEDICPKAGVVVSTARPGKAPAQVSGRSLRKKLQTLLTLSIFIIISACSGQHPLSKQIAQPKYYADNELSFQPKRLWRLVVTWEPYLLDKNKALVNKEFQLVVRDGDERKRIENEIRDKGGDEAYLRWFENHVSAIGYWERRDQARISRHKDVLTVVLTTKAFKEVPLSDYLNVAPVSFPDPLLDAFARHCQPDSWDVLEKGDSAGVEIVLESRHPNPGARRWNRIEKDSRNFSWRAWSVAQENRMSYRTVAFVKETIARCPLPPNVHEQFKLMAHRQSMGVQW